jgi:hypothetical protein
MAKMIGKLIVKDWCGRGCCTTESNKHHVKREELALAFKEAAEEMYEDSDEKHARGMCYDIATKSYGCNVCGDFDDDAYDNSDLDGIEGVTCNVDWREV